ncbi:MAG TPA: hypothetical protein VFZ59_01855 [Verrucomicrobiae bacterium]|nr:hypothetical protein [Verrucomicrobiae bacterium]
MRRLLKILFVAVLTGSAHAHTFRQVGVDSNILIDEGHAIFAQSDGSLTMLAIETGQVLHRAKGRDFSGTLSRIDSGILLLNYGTIALLNPTNLSVLWETTTHYDPNILGNLLVSYDGNGLVECRDLNSGALRWTFDLPGALDVVAISNKVLVHRAATYEAGTPVTVLLDLESGKELFRKSPPPGTHWPEPFFDGEKIYLKQGRYKTKRADYDLQTMAVWNTRGEEIASIPLGANLQTELRWSSSPFELEQKAFYDRRVYPSREAIANERFGLLLPPTKSAEGVSELAYDLGDGFVFFQRDYQSGEASRAPEIGLRVAGGQWIGVLPYLNDRGRIVAVAHAHHALLLGSNLGHVECVRAETGESLWLYVFPTIRQTMSYSSHGMPPMMSQAAATFRQENQNPPAAGLQLLNRPLRPTKVILDPQPFDPFGRLPYLLALSWAGALVPLLMLAFLRWHHQTRNWNLGGISAVLLALTFVCFMAYGRVSPGSSVALRIAMVAAIVFGCIGAVKHIRQGQRILGVILLSIFGGVIFLISPWLLRI